MKAIMKSIRPQHVCNILNLIKELEISTTAPKEWKDYLSGKTDKKPEPIDVYIYVTKSTNDKLMRMSFVNVDTKVKEERFVILHEDCHGKELNSKVVAKFTLKEVEEIAYQQLPNGVGYDSIFYTETIGNIEEKSCLETSDLINYLGISMKDGGIVGYAWHIDNLVVFDKPKEISEFKAQCKKYYCDGCPHYWTDDSAGYSIPKCSKHLTRAPQNYCFIEV